MNAIGLRVSPTEVYYTIIEPSDSGYQIVSISKLIIPKSTDLPNKLSYIRNTFLTIIEQYNIAYAGIKLLEGNARTSINNSMIFRFNVEGVIMELFSNSSVLQYFIGVTSNIASILNIDKASPQEMLSQLVDLSNYKTDDDKTLKDEHKDAIIVALAALEMGDMNE